MEFQTLYDTLAAFGLPGVLAAFVILVTIIFAKRAGLVATGNQARVANVIMAAVIYALRNPSSDAALTAVFASVVAALIHTLIEKIGTNLPASQYLTATNEQIAES